jgi:hypothetical protein
MVVKEEALSPLSTETALKILREMAQTDFKKMSEEKPRLVYQLPNGMVVTVPSHHSVQEE